MDWLLDALQIQNAFAALGSKEGETYVVGPNALSILEEINCKLTYEDQTLRTYRRAIGFGQNVRISLIPLLINTKDPKILDATVRILVNLTVPLECLFSVDRMYRTETGRHTIFEINRLLLTSKEAFTDAKSTKSVLDYVKFILENDTKLSTSHCTTINNCLLLLRNILHIPESNMNFILSQQTAQTSMQNAILWNLFIQSVDKLLIYLMSCPMRKVWGVAMIQLIAVMYKDQHTNTLQKLLNQWFEASISESSGDNESNTSPPKQASGDSSPMLTSDPTSDSSDNGGGRKNEIEEDRRHALSIETEATLQEVSRKGHQYQNELRRNSTLLKEEDEEEEAEESMDFEEAPPQAQLPKEPSPAQTQASTSKDRTKPTFQKPSAPSPAVQKSPHSGNLEMIIGKSCPQKRECPSSQSEQSDCGYGTQVEHQESISTSSNDDDGPDNKPVHQKPPCNQKQRSKSRQTLSQQDCKDLRRKKLVKRSKSSLINMKGFVQNIPTDEDIANIFKEFTVDFLLKGFGYLVQSLHSQLRTNSEIQTDTSHFFWLLTYFLKFSAQLELDLEHIRPIINYDILSYLTYEGVNICEQIELSSRQRESDLKPYMRKMHLVVTAIREYLIALENYKNIDHLSEEDKSELRTLEIQISCTEDLRLLFILLIRMFNPKVHTKQYLQDLIVTNHMLMLVVDNVCRMEEIVNVNITDHIAQFATLEVMHNYGQLLESFNENGLFVNECIFTMMHHISGDLEQIMTLFQPIILKAFTRIWQTDFQLCDDWNDLIEYVIHKFTNTQQKSSLALPSLSLTEMTKEHNLKHTICSWTQEEIDTLYWYYVRSKNATDVVGKIETLFSNNGNKQKSRISIIQQLLQQDIITLVEYDNLMRFEDATYQRTLTKTPTCASTDSGVEIKGDGADKPSDDIQILKDLIVQEGKGEIVEWLQKVLLECCHVKLTLAKNPNSSSCGITHIMEPVAYHCILRNKSVPIVPWNTEQANVMLYQPFVLLLHKLGFQLPADSGSAFARVPEFWSPQAMFDITKKLGHLDKSLIKFDISALDSRQCSETAETAEAAAKEEVVTVVSTKQCAKEVFTSPQIKSSNSIIRYTPESSVPLQVPNWLQLVMRNKSSSSERVDMDSYPSAFHQIGPPPSTPSTSKSIQPLVDATTTTTTADDDSQMNPSETIECSDDGGGTTTVAAGPATKCDGGANFDSEYKAMVASVYEIEIENFDTKSVESDLTRMYVSDEDEVVSIVN